MHGDIVILNEGDRVPADAILFECTNISVDGVALTGESLPVHKLANGSPVRAWVLQVALIGYSFFPVLWWYKA